MPPTVREAGVRFGSGLYRIGEDIQPGRDFSERDIGFESCYRERQDSTGEIIDNFFGQPFRVEVNNAASDYGFLSEDCGEWQPLRLIAFAEGLAEMLGRESDPMERRLHARAIETLCTELGEDMFATERQAGRSMTETEAVDDARMS